MTCTDQERSDVVTPERNEGSGSMGTQMLSAAKHDSQALRVTAKTPLKSAHGKPSLQMSRLHTESLPSISKACIL